MIGIFFFSLKSISLIISNPTLTRYCNKHQCKTHSLWLFFLCLKAHLVLFITVYGREIWILNLLKLISIDYSWKAFALFCCRVLNAIPLTINFCNILQHCSKLNEYSLMTQPSDSKEDTREIIYPKMLSSWICLYPLNLTLFWTDYFRFQVQLSEILVCPLKIDLTSWPKTS